MCVCLCLVCQSVVHRASVVVEGSFVKLEVDTFVPTMVLLLLTTVAAFELVRKSDEQFCQKYLYIFKRSGGRPVFRPTSSQLSKS